MSYHAILLAGGKGTRLDADIPKQYLKVNGRMIIEYTLATFAQVPFDTIVVVAAGEWRDAIMESWLNVLRTSKVRTCSDDCATCDNNCSSSAIRFASPGRNRQESIYNGLLALKENAIKEKDIVLIQDAARPNTSRMLVETCLNACANDANVDGVMPVLPVKDTVYISEDGLTISSLIERKTIFAGQAPEAFVFGKYYEATKSLMPDRIMSINGSSEPAIMAGMNVKLIPGDEHNYKITTEADLRKFISEQG